MAILAVVKSKHCIRRRRSGLLLVVIVVVSVSIFRSRSSESSEGGAVFVPGPVGLRDVAGSAAMQKDVPRSATGGSVADVEVLPGTDVVDARSRTTLLGNARQSNTYVVGGAVAAACVAVAKGSRTSQSQIARQSRGGDAATGDGVGLAIACLGLMIGWIGIMWAIQHSLLPVPFLADDAAMYFPIVATFVVGYGVIVLEEQTEIGKAATALILGVLTWVFIGTGLNLSPESFEEKIKESLEDVSEVVLFLLGALTIVEVMDAHKGFDIITRQITQTKARDLLVTIGVLTFFLSSVLNNLTVVIVMIALLQKVVKDDDLRLRLGGIVVVVSNAGGAWTPIGDITTTMLYIGGQVTTVPLLVNLFFPSILCLIGSLGFEWIKMDGDKEFERPASSAGDDFAPPGQGLVFFGGLAGMISVPIFTALTQCPAWSGMMLVLGLLGVVTHIIHGHGHAAEKYQMKGALERVEVPDCLFFLGVLFAVAGLERVGLLKVFAQQLDALVSNEVIIATLLGFASAIVDNVPLVAASQGMYDIAGHPANSSLWNLITYCAACGGSLLVIGSAAGVAFLGLEKKVTFGWYLENIAPAALVGYLLGICGCVAQEAVGLTIK